MYSFGLLAHIRANHLSRFVWDSRTRIDAVIWKLGITSLLTDLSSEMVTSILPLYFVVHLQFSPLQFGVLDGISQGAAIAVISLTAGMYADRWRRHKEVATFGYALSAVTRLALVAAGAVWSWAAAILVIDRLGKGIRTAPRDTLISAASAPEILATSFAVHRALDTVGAVGGPLLAFALLQLLPDAFDVVFVVSFCVAVIGLSVIALLVGNPPPVRNEIASAGRRPFQGVADLLALPRYQSLVLTGGVLGLFTASDAFLYLVLQRMSNSAGTVIPMYAFVTALVYLVGSVPIGRLADAIGRHRVFLGGYVLVACLYLAVLTFGVTGPRQFVVVGLLGLYYAATDGVLAAMASARLSLDRRSSGLAALNTTIGLARLVSSIMFGWIWNAYSADVALTVFFGSLLAAIVMAARLFHREARA